MSIHELSAGSVRLLRWCGMALVAAGVLMTVATLLHPSSETATTIIASEVGLVAAHLSTRSPGCWCCSDCPDSMCLSVKAWDGWDWQASWLHFPAPI